jgi:hypothetical protein
MNEVRSYEGKWRKLRLNDSDLRRHRQSQIHRTSRARGIGNLAPADVYFGRGQTILLQRERIKRDTIKRRRLQHRRQAA